MKYVLIGCGRIAKNHIKAALNNNLDVAAVCDINREHMDRFLESNMPDYIGNIACYDDYLKMLDEVKPDLAGIATMSGVHAEIALACIDRGIHVIVEKPIAMSMRDADEIVERAEKMKVKVSVCHQNRFNIAVQEMRKAVEQGRFGNLSHGSVHVRWNRNKEYYTQASWRGTWEQDGGALMNQCIHGIDLLRWMLGDKVKEVYGVTDRRVHDYLETEDIGMAVLKFENGAIGTIEGTTNVYPANLEETLYLFGETGTIKLGGKSTNTIDVWEFADTANSDKRNRGLQEETPNVYGNGHTSLYADMIDAISGNRSPYVDAVDGRNAVEIVLAIYKSQKEGKPISLPLKNFASIDMKGEFE